MQERVYVYMRVCMCECIYVCVCVCEYACVRVCAFVAYSEIASEYVYQAEFNLGGELL